MLRGGCSKEWKGAFRVLDAVSTRLGSFGNDLMASVRTKSHFHNVWGVIAALLLVLAPLPLEAEVNPRGLQPADDMTFMPELGGLRNVVYKNQYGMERVLSECIVMRKSEIREGEARVPAGGLFYVSETKDEARPLMRDPFLLLGEHCYLVGLSTEKAVVRNLEVKKREKALLDQSGYRLWYDYATDHYEKPYGEFALITPSGAWPIEFPVSTSFPEPDDVKEVTLPQGTSPQLRDFWMTRDYRYGATRFHAGKITHMAALFDRIEYPRIREAVFAMRRPYVVKVRQEDFRWYYNKRIYAFRKDNGLLIRVTDWTGNKILAEKLLKPSTPQGYKNRNEYQADYAFTIPYLDMHIEVILDPSFMRDSDFVPWSNDVPYGWTHGTVSMAVFSQLLIIRDGEAWPRDNRYTVRLESNLMTGMLKRVILENKESFVLSDEHPVYAGPEKISEVWDRKAFKVVARNFEEKKVHSLYIRDAFFQRTDNMILWKEGRENIDFFVGTSPLLVSILEDTFLVRLADSSFHTVVEGSVFSSYPKVIPSAAFFEPDPTCPFVPRLKGFERKFLKNREKNKLVAGEGLVIRGSYIDYKTERIVIPPGGLYYTSRNSRNVRPLKGEAFLIFGEKAYLCGVESGVSVQKNLRVDFWKHQPMGDGNPLFWQDVSLGDGSKVLRYMGGLYLDDRPMAHLRMIKYSGNPWGGHIIVGQGLSPEGDNRYGLPEIFGEGSTFLKSEYVGPNFLKLREFATPDLKGVRYTYQKPQRVRLGVGEETPIGHYRVLVSSIDREKKTAELVLRNAAGEVLKKKTLGPLDRDLVATLPQYIPSCERVMLDHDDVHMELSLPDPFEGDEVEMFFMTDVRSFFRNTAWAGDPRFVVRPDVCAHCYQLNEFLLDNAEPIILDKDNPVFEGPRTGDRPFFRIVIDDFDGEKIHAWHIETFEGEKVNRTENLAFYPRNNVDVLVGVNGTVEGHLRSSMLHRMSYREHWRVSNHQSGIFDVADRAVHGLN